MTFSRGVFDESVEFTNPLLSGFGVGCGSRWVVNPLVEEELSWALPRRVAAPLQRAAWGIDPDQLSLLRKPQKPAANCGPAVKLDASSSTWVTPVKPSDTASERGSVLFLRVFPGQGERRGPKAF